MFNVRAHTPAHSLVHIQTVYVHRQTHSRSSTSEPNAGKIFKMKQESFLTTVEKEKKQWQQQQHEAHEKL